MLERDGGTRVRRDGGAVGSARERRRRDARYIAWRRRDDEGVAVSVSAVHAMRARVAACMYHTRAIIHKSGDVAVDRFVTTEDTIADGGGAIVSVACVAALAVYTMSEAVVRMRDTSRTMAREDGTTGAKQYRCIIYNSLVHEGDMCGLTRNAGGDGEEVADEVGRVVSDDAWTLLAMCTRTFGEMVGTMRCVEMA